MIMDEFRQKLEANDGTVPPAWKPEVGDVLVGTLERYANASSNYGDSLVAIVKNGDTGALQSVWLRSEALQDQFRKSHPLPGDRVGIKRLPEFPGKKYHRFLVRVDRPAAPPDFGQKEGMPATDDEADHDDRAAGVPF